MRIDCKTCGEPRGDCASPTYCRSCHNARGQAWRKEHPEAAALHARRRQLKKYGLTEIEWDAMFSVQRGLCALCLRDEPLRVDHSHIKGIVRALLCHQCNVALGLTYEDPALLRRMADYVERYG